MDKTNAHPKDGEIYKRIYIGEHTFELRYGYYTDSDREFGEPVVIFPELAKTKLYTDSGLRIVTAVQDPCSFYEASNQKAKEESCIDCIHYYPPCDDIGICKCKSNQKHD